LIAFVSWACNFYAFNIRHEGKVYIYIDTCSRLRNSYAFGTHFDKSFYSTMHIYTCFIHIFYYTIQDNAAQNIEQEEIGSILEQHLEMYF
jgi:hypothetical protein